ncbi:hypothetical protein GE09DRAFT_1052540 [Coniochaeta sp. 2T2.1]|nr:hypothetical protein GE09DRAFT_1052540 [Coniochaeta sp. 2T2.1]
MIFGWVITCLHISQGHWAHESGDEESGDEESGDEESGDEESGDEESGDEESGDEESGDEESGDEESGDEESGDEESGDEESGGEERVVVDAGDVARSGSMTLMKGLARSLGVRGVRGALMSFVEDMVVNWEWPRRVVTQSPWI